MPILGLAMPWETPAGEGFIAPWTDKVETPGGWVQASKASPGDDFDMILTDPRIPPTPLPANGSAQAQEDYQARQQAAGNQGRFDEGLGGAPATNYGQGGGGAQPGDNLAVPAIAGTLGALGIGAGTGTALAGALGLGAVGTGLLGGLGLLASRIKMPWQTPEGEGFIAPWTQQEQLPSGQWGQEGVDYSAPAAAASGLGGMTYAQLKGGVPVKAWTNASKNGRSPATVAFVKFSNGMMASQSLIDGTIQTWRPKKHIVISRDPRLSNVRKLDRVHKRMEKTLAPFARTVYRTKKK